MRHKYIFILIVILLSCQESKKGNITEEIVETENDKQIQNDRVKLDSLLLSSPKAIIDFKNNLPDSIMFNSGPYNHKYNWKDLFTNKVCYHFHYAAIDTSIKLDKPIGPTFLAIFTLRDTINNPNLTYYHDDSEILGGFILKSNSKYFPNFNFIGMDTIEIKKVYGQFDKGTIDKVGYKFNDRNLDFKISDGKVIEIEYYINE